MGWTLDAKTKADQAVVTADTKIKIDSGENFIIQNSSSQTIASFAESATGTIVFNEQGSAMDFRVEGDNDTHTLFVDGSTDRVGINVSDPDSKLEILEATDNQLKLSYDGSNATTFNTSSGGDLTIVPSGGDANVTGNLAVSGDLTITGDDLFMNTNTSGYVLVADGTNYNPVAISGDVTLNSAGAITIAANAVEGSMLNTNVISGQTAMTGDVADTDELLVSDAGTVKRADFSVVRDAVFADVSGDATVASGGALTIANDAVEQAMIGDDAVGADQLASNAVVNASIASGAAIDMDKLDGDSLGTAITDFAQDDLMILSDTSDSGNLVKMTTSNFEDAIFGNVSGDASIAAGGALTIAADSVEGTMLNTNAADTSTIELSSDTLSVLKVPNALTAGDGISAGGTFDGATARTFALDLKSNGGLVIESNEAAVDLGASSITGTLAVGDGGTGATTLTDGGILLGSGTSAITAMAVLADGEMIVGDGTTDPVAESGATLRTSIGVGTGDSPQFTNLTLTGDLTLSSGEKLFLDGSTTSYIYESSDDIVQIVVGGDRMISFDEASHVIYFGDTSGPTSLPVGFTQSVVSFNNSDTVVYFNLTGQKQYVELTDNVTNITSKMPSVSASFTLVVKQDSTGGRVVTNWKVKDSGNNDAAGSATVLWPGGSAPTLSTGANDIDIINFYWDATNEKLFGTAALDFS
tara:strand:+ start:1471 stop:3567 length:2097 start_codon:yes stop_codon:yes gene_type:complete